MGKPCNAATYRRAVFDLAQAEKPQVLVEVGVYAGALSSMLVSLPSLRKQFIVDSWEGGYSGFSQAHMNEIAAGVMEWATQHPKVTVLHLRSVDAAALFDDESIDFFHTDGDHSLDGITSDIRAWLPKVKPGGLLSGDNYEIPAVAAGVKKLLSQHKLLANGRLWYSRKA